MPAILCLQVFRAGSHLTTRLPLLTERLGRGCSVLFSSHLDRMVLSSLGFRSLLIVRCPKYGGRLQSPNH
jgi:hypothetical protein